MKSFILQDIVVCAITTFTIGLYVGAFVQRRRGIKEIMFVRAAVKILLDKLFTRKGGIKCTQNLLHLS